MITDEVDTVVLAVDDVDDPVRAAGLLEQLDEGQAGRRVPLTRLHHVGVPADNTCTERNDKIRENEQGHRFHPIKYKNKTSLETNLWVVNVIHF